jgi:hypothetical protein
MSHPRIQKALAALTATLLGGSLVQAADGNRSETSILIYSEQDRTRATEATFSLHKQLKNDFALGLRLTYDGLTGSTPTGASPSRYAQTVTRASGGRTITVPAGEFPIYEYFADRRFSAAADLSHPLGRMSTATLGVRLSSEHDYSSVGLSAGLTREFNRRNTTVGVSAAVSHDVVKPVGGFYLPFSVVGSELDETAAERRARFEGKVKSVYDFVFSLTQVLDRKTLLRVNYSLGRSDGYLTDPYKIVSVVQSPDSTDPGEPIENLYEHRPGARHQNALFTQLRKHLLGSTADVSYRFYWDDWSVESHAIEFGWHIDFKSTGAIAPRIRWYHQTAAEFSTPFLVKGEPLPDYVSADSRLAAFDAITYGLTYSIPVNPTSRLAITAEYYSQRGDRSPPTSFSSPLAFDLFPKLDVVMVRLGYSHDF